ALIYESGQRSVDFFLLLEGAVEIFDRDPHGVPQVFVTLGPRQFAGELHMFNDREVLVSGRTCGETTVIRIGHTDFRRLMTGEPDIGEIVMRAFILRRVLLIRQAHGGVVVIGAAHTADTLRLKRFLTRNGYPYRLLDIETDPDAGGFMQCLALQPEELPVVVTADHRVLHNPTMAEIAETLGLTERIAEGRYFDVAIVGAGPAGLAAGVYAASEGLETIILEAMAPGGQAGTSSKIENYLGFPTGISGQALAARAQIQAQKFGAHIEIARTVAGLDCSSRPYRLALDDGRIVQAGAVVIATGARYRKLDLVDCERFEGQGIHYAATAMEAQLCSGEPVIVVGGGNSAGQAAMFLTRHAAHVHMVVRAEGLAATMSDYLVQRIHQSPHITLHTRTTISAFDGDERLRRVSWTKLETGESETHPVGNIFVMIGADPNTDWLDDCLSLDPKGFILTGSACDGAMSSSPYETSRPGIYAVGDVRARSVKRVASAVGEGSVVVQAVHQFLHPVA
ncbi:MAG TPA: FAD-dependent oxidoreductase, partial [Alphaproteobacteria bacterium]|nr:FAD-dependent oxidoreductase [Alphaproteobacteria bacterium]